MRNKVDTLHNYSYRHKEFEMKLMLKLETHILLMLMVNIIILIKPAYHFAIVKSVRILNSAPRMEYRREIDI
jgi:hypothetical protein